MSTMSSSQSRTDYGHNKSMSDVKSDAAAVRKDLTALTEDVVDVGSRVAHQAADRIKSGAESASEMAKSAGQQAIAAHESVCKQVSTHPTAAVLISLGVGAILGRMMWR